MNVPSRVGYIEIQFIFKIIGHAEEGEISPQISKKKYITQLQSTSPRYIIR
jgi:hypothetical protein